MAYYAAGHRCLSVRTDGSIRLTAALGGEATGTPTGEDLKDYQVLS